jgi:hypothetical protein
MIHFIPPMHPIIAVYLKQVNKNRLFCKQIQHLIDNGDILLYNNIKHLIFKGKDRNMSRSAKKTSAIALFIALS